MCVILSTQGILCLRVIKMVPDDAPYHVHDCENVRGDITLAVLFHHLCICYYEGFYIETLL